MSDLARWGGIGLTVLGTIVGAVIYLQTLNSTVSDLEHELHEQTILLSEIQSTQAEHFAQRENRFEELEVGQRNIKDTFTTSQDDLFFQIGVLSGRLLEKEGRDGSYD